MDALDVLPLIEQLDDNIGDLEEALQPLTDQALSDTIGKLPLLDRAKAYTLVTYAIESTLFCDYFHCHIASVPKLTCQAYVRLNGFNAKEHPVFRELTRVRQYFDKIKDAESKGQEKNSMSLDRAVTNRIVKHALVRFPAWPKAPCG